MALLDWLARALAPAPRVHINPPPAGPPPPPPPMPFRTKPHVHYYKWSDVQAERRGGPPPKCSGCGA